MKSYILYKITNLANGKMYIGKHITSNVNDGYMGSGNLIRCAIKKYGLQNFRKEIIMLCEDNDDLCYWERAFVDETWLLRSDTYNLAIGGFGGSQTYKGKHLPASVIEKIRAKAIGRKQSLETIAKKIKSMTGKHRSEQFKQNRRELIEAGKFGSFGQKGIVPINKGKKNLWHPNDEQRDTLSKLATGSVFWNNGQINKRAKACPGPEWKREHL